MKCTNCDRPLVPGARFCGKCGTLVPQPIATTPKTRIMINDDISDDGPVLPSAPKLARKDDVVIADTTRQIRPANGSHLLEGPHPALLKARRLTEKAALSAKPALADRATPPEDDEDEMLPEHVETDTHPDTGHRDPRSTAPAKPVHPDIPGPRYPFGQQMSDKNYFSAFLLAFFLGVFGADRFYTGQHGAAVLKLLTAGGLGLWAYIDALLLLANLRRDRYGRRLWGRAKDFRASVWIFVGFTVLGAVLATLIVLATLNADPGTFAP